MKIFAFALVACVASASAMPHIPVEEAIRSGETRLVTNQIEQAIKDVSQAIVDAGLDPFVIDHKSSEYALPVPSIFNYRSRVSDLLFKGASNIVITRLSMSVLTLRLNFDISLPEILLDVADSELNLHLFGKNFDGHLSGRLVMKNIQTTGSMRFSLGIITGTTLSSIELAFKLGAIESQMQVGILGVDCSDAFNNYFIHTVTGTLNQYEGEINDLLTMVGKDYIESML